MPNGITLEKIKEIAESAYKDATRYDGRDRQGGWLCVIDENGLISVLAIGNPDAHSDKTESWKFNCQEKANRLFDHPEHRSAWESRCHEKGWYYGGIRIPASGVVVAFSGLTEHLDEALCAHIATKFPLGVELVRSEWWHIRNLSHNTHMNEYGQILAKAA